MFGLAQLVLDEFGEPMGSPSTCTAGSVVLSEVQATTAYYYIAVGENQPLGG